MWLTVIPWIASSFVLPNVNNQQFRPFNVHQASSDAQQASSHFWPKVVPREHRLLPPLLVWGTEDSRCHLPVSLAFLDASVQFDLGSVENNQRDVEEHSFHTDVRWYLVRCNFLEDYPRYDWSDASVDDRPDLWGEREKIRVDERVNDGKDTNIQPT